MKSPHKSTIIVAGTCILTVALVVRRIRLFGRREKYGRQKSFQQEDLALQTIGMLLWQPIQRWRLVREAKRELAARTIQDTWRSYFRQEGLSAVASTPQHAALEQNHQHQVSKELLVVQLDKAGKEYKSGDSSTDSVSDTCSSSHDEHSFDTSDYLESPHTKEIMSQPFEFEEFFLPNEIARQLFGQPDDTSAVLDSVFA